MTAQTVKIEVSLPQEEFRQIERLRRELKLSRSALITQAIRQLLEERQRKDNIQRYITGYRDHPETPEEYAGFQEMAQRAFSQEPWNGEQG
ncbi:MAG TPA: ribbon-helix-helix protein, CopG family [Candidatus Fraserbacteria bacterium]|nr:ribbon-helix-helix protein, CopG family [Candidatus Fraserbacteria bacterium]